jgi:hypothetical protein
MTQEELQKKCEDLRRFGEEICKTPESARAFLDQLEARIGKPVDQEQFSRSKKKNNA